MAVDHGNDNDVAVIEQNACLSCRIPEVILSKVAEYYNVAKNSANTSTE